MRVPPGYVIARNPRTLVLTPNELLGLLIDTFSPAPRFQSDYALVR